MRHDDPGTPHDPGRRPWRLGLLSLLALALVVTGVLAFGGSDDDGATTTAPEASGLTIPPLPAGVGGSDSAPDFALELFDGTRFSLSSHLEDDGRPVILNLWASWCPPCREEMPDLERASVANPEVVILGVAVDDDPQAAADFATEIEITYPAGYDERGSVSRAFPTSSLPVTFVISSEGEVLHTVFGRLTPEEIGRLVDLALAG